MRTAFDSYVAEDYVQHNPGLPDGRDVALEPLAQMFDDPGFAPEVVRLLVDGDLCAVHLRISRDGSPVAAVVDLYRWDGEGRSSSTGTSFSRGRQTSANDHPLF